MLLRHVRHAARTCPACRHAACRVLSGPSHVLLRVPGQYAVLSLHVQEQQTLSMLCSAQSPELGFGLRRWCRVTGSAAVC